MFYSIILSSHNNRFKQDAEAQERIVGKAWILKNKDSEIYKVLTSLELDQTTLVRPFSIENFSLSFLLLIVGLGISVLSLVLEKVLFNQSNAAMHIIM